MKEQVILSWSGGKDSALALYHLQKSKEYEVVGLLTTITEEYDRISMHSVRLELLEQQVQSIGLPLHKVIIPKGCTNEEYAERMRATLSSLPSITTYAFGDLFLQDIRSYREEQLSLVNKKAIFPLWGMDTTLLAHAFIDLGFKAVTTCVDPRSLSEKFAGRKYDTEFLSELSESVDPCGENGEFHTFVYEAPIFSSPISITVGETVERDGFYYTDVVSKASVEV